MSDPRIERDSLGEVAVPASSLWGAQTQRAVDNFQFSEWRFGRRFIRALGLVKQVSAQANRELGTLPAEVAEAVFAAAAEVAEGHHDDQFVVDVFQTGSGTSTNMNANEVIAARASTISAAGTAGIHANDHVNRCQSSNDVIPTAGNVAALIAITEALIPGLDGLARALERKSREFSAIVKSGRTHLMDAAPVTLGQEFGGYASQIEHGLARLAGALPNLAELPLGGTAVGTGLNAHPEFAPRAIQLLSQATGLPLQEAPNHFEAQGARDAMVEASGVLKTVAVSMAKIANDIRWLASGPGSSLGEIVLPALQPGSSIMPGKVNPVIPEAVLQVCAQVIGNDSALTLGGMGGVFELNTMMPLMIYDLLFSIETLAGAARALAACIEGIEADEDRCRELLGRNLMLATALVPLFGYDETAEIAREARISGKTLKQVLLERRLLSEEELDSILDARKMTQGGLPD